MNDAFPRGQTAIVGAATFGVGKAPGYATFDLAAHRQRQGAGRRPA